MKNAIFTTLFILVSLAMNAQFDQNIEYIVITKSDGKIVKGVFKEMTSREITYFSNGEYYTINRDDIIDFNISDDWSTTSSTDTNGKDYSDQYLLFQSALPAGKGNNYFRNYDLVVNQVTVGVSDQFTFSGGFESISLFVNEGAPIIFFTPKFSFGQDNIHFSVSTTAFINGSDFVGLANGHMTIGNRKNNLTLGLSLAYTGSEVADEIVVSLSGMISLNQKLSITSDLMSVNEVGILFFDTGIRYIASNGIGLDASLLYVLDVDTRIPVIGLTFPFSSK